LSEPVVRQSIKKTNQGDEGLTDGIEDDEGILKYTKT
jgi:hypothetical protein